jgi:gas vesicle protein
MKHAAFILIFALAFASFACSGEEKYPGTVTTEKEVAKEDGSTVVVSKNQEGFKSETRTFPSGDISRATRITKPDGKRRALVEFRDGRTVELKEESDIEHLLDNSADSIKDAATQTWEATKAVGEKVGEKTAETGKKVGEEVSDKTKQGAEATKDAAVDAAEAAGKGIKKAGKAVKKAGEKVKDKVTP